MSLFKFALYRIPGPGSPTKLSLLLWRRPSSPLVVVRQRLHISWVFRGLHPKLPHHVLNLTLFQACPFRTDPCRFSVTKCVERGLEFRGFFQLLGRNIQHTQCAFDATGFQHTLLYFLFVFVLCRKQIRRVEVGTGFFFPL